MGFLYKKLPFSHAQTRWAGKHYNWFSSDSSDVYQRNFYEKQSELADAGWDNPDQPIVYRFNKAGFRDDNFDNQPAGIALGCSLTFGVGVHEHCAWPQLLSEKLGMRVWNLGIAGGGQDVCFRVLDHMLDELQPQFVIYQQPSPWRWEFFDSEWKMVLAAHFGNIAEEFSPFVKTWFTHQENIIAQGRRNMLAIRQRCYETNTPLFITQESINMDQRARDLQHPGPESLQKFTDYVYSQRHLYLGEQHES